MADYKNHTPPSEWPRIEADINSGKAFETPGKDSQKKERVYLWQIKMPNSVVLTAILAIIAVLIKMCFDTFSN